MCSFNRLLSVVCCLLPISLSASIYCGRVVNSSGEPLPYATIYPINDPVSGTATNNDGYFSFEAFLAQGSEVVISYVGYEKASINEFLLRQTPDTLPPTIILSEQPIGLEEMVVSAKQPKYNNKRKQMTLLLQAVYEQIKVDFPTTPTSYFMVSDVRMDSEGKPWGVEQMIANAVIIPREALPPYPSTHNLSDSVQFHGEYCKRYFNPTIRRLADSIYTTDILEQMGSQTRKAATAIDSGVIVHKGLFAAGNIKKELAENIGDIKHWSVNRENDSLTVLTYSVKKTMMLFFKVHYTIHYIVDSHTLRLMRTSQQMQLDVTIPFGIKLDAGQLALLNMLNLSEKQIDKFRLRQAHALIHYNTLFAPVGDKLYILEKNLHTDATIIGAKKQTIPLEVNATQRMTKVTPNAAPLTRGQLTRRLQREIVEIY